LELTPCNLPEDSGQGISYAAAGIGEAGKLPILFSNVPQFTRKRARDALASLAFLGGKDRRNNAMLGR
jgi:hypothetical protein